MAPEMEDVQQLVSALITVSGGLERARRRIRDAGTLALLAIVGSRSGIRPSEIAAELGVNQSSVTRQVQALARAGHVEVSADLNDRRSCLLELTSAGREELHRLNRIGMDLFMKFVADWDAEDVRTLARLLWKFEESKAEVGRHERHASGRFWQQS
jgi:DNA-binding MarR family transcriptional regulator